MFKLWFQNFAYQTRDLIFNKSKQMTSHKILLYKFSLFLLFGSASGCEHLCINIFPNNYVIFYRSVKKSRMSTTLGAETFASRKIREIFAFHDLKLKLLSVKMQVITETL